MSQLHLHRMVCLLFLIAGTAHASPFYVGKTGSDNNSCAQAQSQSAPKRTIGGGISCLGSGQTLIIFGGTYYETNLGNEIPNGMSWDSVTTIRANLGDTVTVMPSGSLNRAWFFGGTSTTKAYIEINGIDCDGQNAVSHCVKVDGASHHLRFRNVHFRNTRGSLMLFSERAGDNSPGYHEVLDSHLHHGGQDPSFGSHAFDHGIYLEHDNTKIWGNNIHDIPGWGLHIYSGHTGVTPENTDIQYNEIWNCGDTQFGTNRGQAITTYGINTLIANNVIYNNLEGGISVRGSNTRIFNNTITGSTGGTNNGALYIGNSNNHIVRNNIIWEAVVPAIQYNGYSITQSNNLFSDPLFDDAASNNYYLQGGSSAINSGTMLAEVTDDFNRVPRPQGGGMDVGAFEFVGQSPPVPAASIPLAPSLLRAD